MYGFYFYYSRFMVGIRESGSSKVCEKKKKKALEERSERLKSGEEIIIHRWQHYSPRDLSVRMHYHR